MSGTTLYEAHLLRQPSLRPAYAYGQTLPSMEPDIPLLHLPQIAPTTRMGGSGAIQEDFCLNIDFTIVNQ